MPQLDVTTYTSQLFWLCLSFGVLWMGLHLMLPALRAVRRERERYILAQIAKAKECETEGERLEEAQKRQLEKAQGSARKRIATALESMHEAGRKEKMHLNAKSHEEWALAEKNLEAAYEEEKKSLKERTAPLTEMLLKKMLACYSRKVR